MRKKALNRGMRISFMMVTLFITSAVITTSDAEEVPAIFGDVTIDRQFSPDPMTVRGMSGGLVSGNQVAGKDETATGPCNGFVDETPDHTLALTSKFDYLRLQIQSPEDTTMIVKGPGGTWCNDDFDGKNSGIIGEWLPGSYQIWVGSYNQGKYLPYTLQITTEAK
ncbi:hypothetical protein FNW02_31035 [Komarekiella sp. 'clone 1']|uniref:Uncharacterized protein n=1 Tax=Komarekiella delphini-convector SJRDD-AB1 TaxID=2593771 RepID=A0AA40T381_9NOST|nr:hypothetical protein [Komarekiella delphini-convector]MBD6620111.1 hypothetical protein [Komarekiella delphini-convector SJRDD-AB1]